MLIHLVRTAQKVSHGFANGCTDHKSPTSRDVFFFPALMSDAFHLLSDVASFIVALAAIYLAEKPATRRKLHFIFLSLKLE